MACSFFFILLFTACSNTYHPIDIYEVIIPRTEVSRVLDIPITPINIRIEPVIDARTNTSVAILDEQQITAKSDISEVISSSITKTLETAGFRASSSGSIILVGEVRKYFANFEGNFPSEGEAEIVLSVNVKEPQSRRSYTAQYLGSAKLQTILASPKEVSGILESALESALRQMLKDKTMLSFLRSGDSNRGSLKSNDLY